MWCWAINNNKESVDKLIENSRVINATDLNYSTIGEFFCSENRQDFLKNILHVFRIA